ncbi:DNase I-like protein [Cucurbitaria berberidis CBS 394.84]|uniref:DNase I-like protein n=1 Tax=Cucurbitaria berberidis CBS 394.84 TaxID=1168544 RepID=A0A9P4GIA2_9PLEO|nr:DNase I-like protein [Cucurbitaria berberidis CBS 394.84]KAF1846152.1 DNase I-like protein [Cucurbitaria berberidis CBS 394.84]
MDRDISPPPAKRRKFAAQRASRIQTSPLPAPEALPPIDSNVLRIFSWNINGIAPFLQKPITSFFQTSNKKAQGAKDAIPPASLRGFLQRHGWPAMLFLQEVKVATKDTKTQNDVKAAVKSRSPSEMTSGHNGPTYEAHFTLPNDPYNARGLRGNGKVYGVCSILRSDLRKDFDVNIRTVDWDQEGRISVVEVTSTSRKMAIYNIYAVNGTENPYRDPTTGAIRGTRHDRKLEFHRLLMQECMDLEKAGWEVLLAGDMNVAPDARDGYPKLRTFPQQHIVNRADFHEKLLEGKGLNGVDVWRQMHAEEKRYTYFSRGREWGTSCDRVDYFIAGRKAWDDGHIKACGILDSEAERGPSDHVPIWADVELERNDKVEIGA